MNRAASQSTFSYPDAVKDSLIAAAIAAALMVPLIGIYTVQESGGLAIRTRFADVGFGILYVFAGRLSLALAAGGKKLWGLLGGVIMILTGVFLVDPVSLLGVAGIGGGGVVTFRTLWLSRGEAVREACSSVGQNASAIQDRYGFYIGLGLIALAALFPFSPVADRWILDLAILVMTYILLGWGLNIVVGLAGLLDLGYVAFYAVGAYSFALLAHYYQLGFWVCLPAGAAMAALFGIILGFPVLRLRGDYLAIVTLGFGEMIRIVLINWVSLTRGPDGISGIPKPTFFGLEFKRRASEGVETFHQFFDLPYRSIDRVIFLFYIALFLVIATNWFIRRIRKLPIGRAWEALREDEIASRALGLNPTNVKLSAFALGAMFGGIAGTLFAARQGFISPESFTFIESAIILSVVVLGGMGSQLGVAIAAVVLIGLPEWFRDLEHYRMLTFGALMVLIMAWRPRGLLSHRSPTVTLSPDRLRAAGGERHGAA